jgi:hypothetical protein
MSVNAYILINVEPERIPEVVERLHAIPGGIVREVVGPYDGWLSWKQTRKRILPESCATTSAPFKGLPMLYPVRGMLEMLVGMRECDS